MENEGTRKLLERWRIAQHESIGVDPDGIAYLDAAERIEQARAAYRAQVAEVEIDAEERRATLVGVAGELE